MMMEIDCPKCGKENEINGENLPDNACDNEEYECKYCEHEFNIGWYAEVEIR